MKYHIENKKPCDFCNNQRWIGWKFRDWAVICDCPVCSNGSWGVYQRQEKYFEDLICRH